MICVCVCVRDTCLLMTVWPMLSSIPGNELNSSEGELYTPRESDGSTVKT